jgi:hypothetical protein
MGLIGRLIGKVNWPNVVENLIYIIITAIVVGYVSYKAAVMGAIEASDRVVENLIPTINKAIDKETIANEIVNQIDLQVDKIKKSDSINININQVPNNNQKPINIIQKEKDTCIDISKLTQSQKRRLVRWLK